MLFKNIHFILVRPQLGENIGAAARSLKNFNFENLRLVSPRDSWPNKSAVYTAVEAKDIVHKAKLFTNNDQAVSDLDYIFATTSRSRSVNKKIITTIFKKYNFISSIFESLIRFNGRKQLNEKFKRIIRGA